MGSFSSLLKLIPGMNQIKDLDIDDKEFDKFNSDRAKKYFYKLKNMCEKYKNYCNFSFIFDFNGLLEEKDSPIDKGKEIFEQLMKERVEVK